MSNYKQKLTSDFNDFDKLLNNTNHVVRRYFHMYINGDYGEDIFTKWLARYQIATTDKKLRALVIQAFLEYNALDYGCTSQQVQRWLMANIGIEKLEQLNLELIKDVQDAYSEVA
mgnify:FL=1